jgi:hypothetical protein
MITGFRRGKCCINCKHFWEGYYIHSCDIKKTDAETKTAQVAPFCVCDQYEVNVKAHDTEIIKELS